MSLRSFKIVELGVGSAHKIVELSGKPRHAKDEFLGVDIEQAKVQSHQGLKSVGGVELPDIPMEKVLPQPNLRVTRGKDAASFLAEQKPSSVDHLYAHFLVHDLPLAKRKILFARAMQAMRPGARFVIVEGVFWNAQLRDEILKAGFSVHSKHLSIADLRRLGTEHALNRASSYAHLLKTLRAVPPSVIEGVTRRGVALSREFYRKYFEKVEGKKRSKEVRAAIARVVEDLHLIYKQQALPWVAVYARKPVSAAK